MYKKIGKVEKKNLDYINQKFLKCFSKVKIKLNYLRNKNDFFLFSNFILPNKFFKC